MGCKLTTTREEKEKSVRENIHSAAASSSPSSPSSPGLSHKALTSSPQATVSAAESAQKPADTVSSPPVSPKDDAVLSLPSTSSSCNLAAYYDPLPTEKAAASPKKVEPSPKKAKAPKKSKKCKVPRTASVDKADVFSDTSSRYSMSVERQRERQEAADSPESNGSFNTELGGTMRSASSSVSRTGDSMFDRGHGMAASHLVSDHPQASDPIALLLSPRQRTVSLVEQLPANGQTKTVASPRRAGGPPTCHANGTQRSQRRTPVTHEDDNELVLACMDCGMEISDDKTTTICPLTGKIHM